MSLFWLNAPETVPADLHGQLTDENLVAFTEFKNKLIELEDFSKENIKQLINTCCKEHKLKFKV